MAVVKDVPTDMSAAATGLSLTFSKLEEVQTERRGEGKSQKEKKQKTTNEEQNTYTKKMYTQLGLALGQKGRRKKRHKAPKFSPQNTAGFFY